MKNKSFVLDVAVIVDKLDTLTQWLGARHVAAEKRLALARDKSLPPSAKGLPFHSPDVAEAERELAALAHDIDTAHVLLFVLDEAGREHMPMTLDLDDLMWLLRPMNHPIDAKF